MRKVFTIYVLLVVLLTISCQKQDSNLTSGGDKIKVAYVINGALGDKAFYDSGQSGMDKIAENFNVEITTIENNFDPARYNQSMEAVVRWGADVVFVIPYGYEDLLIDYVKRYPNIKFISIEPVVVASNLVSVDFKETEGSFLAGVLAATMTTNTSLPKINKDKIVGVIIGDDSPVSLEFVYGYEQGVKYIDNDIEVKTTIISDWADSVKGKQAANQMYAQGVDIIFQVAALTGIGVLEAAKEADKYAIGVDMNQNSIQPGFIPTSMVKDVGATIYLLYDMYANGILPEEGIVEAGSEEGVIYLAIDDYTKSIVPEDTLVFLDEVTQKVNTGEITLEK